MGTQQIFIAIAFVEFFLEELTESSNGKEQIQDSVDEADVLLRTRLTTRVEKLQYSHFSEIRKI